MIPGFLTLFTSLAYGFASPVQPAVQEGCPAPYAAMESRIRYFLTEPGLSEVRARYNVKPEAGAEVVALSNAKDRDICLQLWAAVRALPERTVARTDRVAFYRSGDLYFVSIHPRLPTDRLVIGETGGIEIYDSRFRFVVRLMA